MKKLLIVSLIILLAGCKTIGREKPIEEIQTVIKWRTYDCGTPPTTDNAELKVPYLRIIDGRYTYDGQNYGNLADAGTASIRAIEQMGVVIEFYEDCIKTANEKENQ